MSSEQIAQVMADYGEKEYISGIIVLSDVSVISQLENWFNPDEPYFLSVRLNQSRGMLRIDIFPLSRRIHKFNNLFSRLGELSLLLFGSLNVRWDGDLLYGAEYFYGYYYNELSPEVVQRLLHHSIMEARCVERTLLFETLIESGFSKQQANGFVESIFGTSPITELTSLVSDFENQKRQEIILGQNQ